MFEIGLPFHRQARVWIDDLPPASFDADEVYEQIILSGKPIFSETRRVAIELLVPKGARVLYGLLGAEFQPSESGDLRVVIEALSSDGSPFENALLPSLLDEVQIGLPRLYVPGVFEGVTRVNEWSLPPGRLHFQAAAYGVVSSCEAIFRVLSFTVVRLLMQNPRPTSEQELLPFLQIEI